MKATEFLLSEVLNVILNQKKSRHLTAKKFDKFMYKRFSENDENEDIFDLKNWLLALSV